MIEIRKTDGFAAWLDGLRDMQARLRVLVRIERLAGGNPGDVRPIGEGLSELRIDYGPGYRVYFTQRGSGYSNCAGFSATFVGARPNG
jgi:putative addiction module killer protein